MNFVGFLNGLFRWRKTEKMRKARTNKETTQEAAARALHIMASSRSSDPGRRH